MHCPLDPITSERRRKRHLLACAMREQIARQNIDAGGRICGKCGACKILNGDRGNELIKGVVSSTVG